MPGEATQDLLVGENEKVLSVAFGSDRPLNHFPHSSHLARILKAYAMHEETQLKEIVDLIKMQDPNIRGKCIAEFQDLEEPNSEVDHR